MSELSHMNIEHYASLLKELSRRKKRILSENAARFGTLLEDNREATQGYLSQQRRSMNTLLMDYMQATQVWEADNRRFSKSFNILDFFTLTEPVHSYLLSDLVNTRGKHGQGRLFLDLFLQRLGMDDIQKGTWVTVPEKARVDILVERKEFHNIILIENKANNAFDQPNQLYRYWYFTIFLSDRSTFPLGQLPELLPSRYRMIYLVANGWKRPDPQSMCRPDWLMDPTAPDKIPSQWVERWTFREHVVPLLMNALTSIDLENHRLREYLQQYIEILQTLN